MAGNEKVLSQIVKRALSGEGAHAKTETVFEGVDWNTAASRPPSAPHSIYQLLKHMSYWQNWVLQWLDGKDPAIPKHAASSWAPQIGPANANEWKQAVSDFHEDLKKLEMLAGTVDLLGRMGRTSRLRMLHTIASHNSYHAGQVVALRQLLGKWPPPAGGLTW